MPGSKGLTPCELAHRWGKDLGTRPNIHVLLNHDINYTTFFYFLWIFTNF